MNRFDEVIERIRKLLALAGGSANEHEAAVAASCAADMMDRYHLERAQVEVGTGERVISPIEDEALGDGADRVVQWRLQLASALAKIHGCRAYWCRGVTMLGRRDDIRAIGYSYAYLSNEVDLLAEKAWQAQSDKARPRAWKNAFRVGCVDRIAVRLREARQREAGPSSAAALAILRRDHEEVETKWAAYLAEGTMQKASPATVSSHMGYTAGQEAGDGVRLDGGPALEGAR